MKTGKIPENVLKRAVLRQIGIRNGINGSGAGIGNDCAIFPFSGTDWEQAGMSPAEAGVPALCTQEAVLAWKEAPGIGDVFMTMAELIQKCANNLAAGGACPAAVMIALFVPESAEEADVRVWMAEAAQKCTELSIKIIGGQTRTVSAAICPMAVVTGYGIASAGHCVIGRAEPGQDVVVSKWIGLQGTAVLVRRHKERLLQRYPAYLVKEAEGFGRYLSVLPEAEIALQHGVSAMHDASEGGIFGALWELAEGSDVGLQIDMRKLPLRQETVEVCESCNVNPYELMSGGCLVMTAEDGPSLKAALEAAYIPAAVVGKVTAGKERILRNRDEIRYMNRPERDGIYV